MKYVMISIMTLTLLTAVQANAEDQAPTAQQPKTKGVEVVPETATAILQKASALLTGDLTVTMPPAENKDKNGYTVTPQGIKVPKATLGKYDNGVR